jgi:hypothetical protein
LLAKEIDDSMGGKPVQVRVTQGKEVLILNEYLKFLELLIRFCSLAGALQAAVQGADDSATGRKPFWFQKPSRRCIGEARRHSTLPSQEQVIATHRKSQPTVAIRVANNE